jgi:hypothetical protein
MAMARWLPTFLRKCKTRMLGGGCPEIETLAGGATVEPSSTSRYSIGAGVFRSVSLSRAMRMRAEFQSS